MSVMHQPSVPGAAHPGLDGFRPFQPVPAAQRVLDSGDLFTAGREVLIQHAEEFYRLRLTRKGKLILTK